MGGSTNKDGSTALMEAVEGWLSSSDAGRTSSDFNRLVEGWGMEDVLCALADKHWYNRADVLKHLIETDKFRHAERPAGEPLTVAYYFRSITNGGAQRMAAETCNLWADAQGESFRRVVLITDGGPEDGEYPLDPRVRRAFLPPASKSGYRARYQAWQRVLDEEGIDVVVSASWIHDYSPWDVLAAKSHASRPAFVLCDTSFSIRPYLFPGDQALALTYLYRLVDGVAVLSECDRSYVGRFCANARYIPNTLGYLADNAPAEPEGHSIVWTGRIAGEKRPVDLIYMMERVVQRVPDARLYLVGDGDEELTGRMHDEAVRLGLEGSVIFTGFVTDVGPWYGKASVCVCTSKMEGFSLAIAEALSHSLPVAMYDLPWLEFVRDGRGIRTVEQGRYDLLAREVVQLLEDPEGARRVGREGRGQIDDLLQVDIASEWQALFAGIDPGARPAGWDSDERVLFQYATEFQEEGKQKLRDQSSALKAELRSCSDRLTARIDVKNAGGADNDVEVLELSDPGAVVDAPGWFRDGDGAGRVVRSSAGSLRMRLRCRGAGELSIVLRGQDVKGEDGERVPAWIDCTSLSMDGRELLDGTRAVWHNRPLIHRIPVEDGQVAEVSLSWHSHDEVALETERAARDELRARNSELMAIKNSRSYKIGRAITWLPRKVKGWLLGRRRKG